MLLATFVVLTLIFGFLSAYEFVQVQRVKSSSITTSTSTVTATLTNTSTTVTTETLFTTTTITELTTNTTQFTVPGTIIPASYFAIFLSQSSVQVVQGENKILCLVSAAAYKYNVSSMGTVTTTWNDPITLQQASIVPSGSGFTVSFGTNPIFVGGYSTVIGNFTNAVPGTYTVTISGNSAGTDWVQPLVVTVLPRAS
jgi:hypothetical protein